MERAVPARARKLDPLECILDHELIHVSRPTPTGTFLESTCPRIAAESAPLPLWLAATDST